MILCVLTFVSDCSPTLSLFVPDANAAVAKIIVTVWHVKMLLVVLN